MMDIQAHVDTTDGQAHELGAFITNLELTLGLGRMSPPFAPSQFQAVAGRLWLESASWLPPIQLLGATLTLTLSGETQKDGAVMVCVITETTTSHAGMRLCFEDKVLYRWRTTCIPPNLLSASRQEPAP